MIRVLVRRNGEGSIQEVKIEGHAEYAEHGKDIVCAGVSAITFGTANAIKQLVGLSIVASMGKAGFLQFKTPDIQNPQLEQKTQLLLEGMLISLQTIEESYKKFIRIEDKQ